MSRHGPLRHRLALAGRVLVAVVLFAWLGTQVDWRALAGTFTRLDPVVGLVGLGVLWLGLAIAVARWRCILGALGSDLRAGEVARIFGAGLFLSLFLPTTIGGDVYRLARVGKGGFGAARGALSLLAERGIGLVALVLLVSPVIAVHPTTRDLLPLAVLLAAAGVSVVAAVSLWGRTIATYLARRLPALEPALGEAHWGPLMRRAPAVFGLSLLIHLTTVGANLLFARALHVPLAPWDGLALVPLIVLAGQIPISPGGLGVREAGFVYFLGRAGIGKEGALAVGLTWLAATYVTGALGAILFLADRRTAGLTARSSGNRVAT